MKIIFRIILIFILSTKLAVAEYIPDLSKYSSVMPMSLDNFFRAYLKKRIEPFDLEKMPAKGYLQGKRFVFKSFFEIVSYSLGNTNKLFENKQGYTLASWCMIGACLDRRSLIFQKNKYQHPIFVQTYSFHIYIFYKKDLNIEDLSLINNWVKEKFETEQKEIKFIFLRR